MRNVSFFLTTDQVRNSTPDNPLKDITRRVGWKNLKPGTDLMACVKCQGIKPGELQRIRPIKVDSVRSEPLNALTEYLTPKEDKPPTYTEAEAFDEVRREGFPKMTPSEFVAMFCDHMACEPTQVVQRIVFKYPAPVSQPQQTEFDVPGGHRGISTIHFG